MPNNNETNLEKKCLFRGKKLELNKKENILRSSAFRSVEYYCKFYPPSVIKVERM